MQLRLGINNCFAVKRWPRPADWGPIVRDRLGLRLVQHSFDLVDLGVDDPAALRQASSDARPASSTPRSPAWRPTRRTCCSTRRRRRVARPRRWYGAAIDWTAAAGGRRPAATSARSRVADWNDAGTRRERWSDLRASLARLAERARAAGLDHLVVENLAAAREPSTMADDPGPRHGRRRRPRADPPLPRRRPHVRPRDQRPGARSVRLARRPWGRSAHGRPAPAVGRRTATTTGRSPRPATPPAGSMPTASIDALGEGGVESCALILEVIPPFEQPDDEVLDDLVASVDYWREALDRRGVLAP